MTDAVESIENKELERAVAEGGAYEVIRKRLLEQAERLGVSATALNQARLEEFGASSLELIGRVRVHTENNCIARDIALLDNSLLFGYNVFIGLRKETQVGDVFGLYRLIVTDEGYEIEARPLAGTFLDDPGFMRDFQELYTYYKATRLSKLLVANQHLYATFQIGDKLSDIKVFRWSIANDGSVRYLDNRGERSLPVAPRYDFEWKVCDRESFIQGRHPHIGIHDEVFVDNLKGTLTFKIENNTENGLGIYEEAVEDKNQSLADAAVHYARLGGLIVIKVLPYREEQWRYFVFDTKLKRVSRIDAIGEACLQLPEDHGLIFPGGYYLESGEHKFFDEDIRGMQFERMVRSPNGEDVLYRFYEPHSGRVAISIYNLIRKDLQSPLIGHGFARFDDGVAMLFNTESEEPTRNHPMQVWRTPFYSDDHVPAENHGNSLLGKVGNAELVRAVSELYSVIHSIREQRPSTLLYEELIKQCGAILDGYYWIDKVEAGAIGELVRLIRETAELVLDEFEKVQSIQQRANQSLREAEQHQRDLIREINRRDYRKPDDHVVGLKGINLQRGHLMTLREMRYIDLAAIDRLDAELVGAQERLANRTVEFLQREDAFEAYTQVINEILAEAEKQETVAELKPRQQRLDEIGEGLDLLSEMLNSLAVDDTTVRTDILANLSSVYAQLNQAKAQLRNRIKSIGSRESVAEFGAQFTLFSQSVINALGLAITPEKCDEQLSKLLVQMEEFESKFSDQDQFLNDIIAKREEVYEIFEAHKQNLLDERQRRIHNLTTAAERLLEGIEKRTRSMQSQDEINAYFAADTMVNKVRALSANLRELGDAVRADDLDSRLKSAKEHSVRAQRDKQDLFEEGGSVIKLGRHRFSISAQATDLTLVPRDEGLAFHLTGTDYFEPLQDEKLMSLQDYWAQSLPSENGQVYRGEYLAYQLLRAAERGESDLSLSLLMEQRRDEDQLTATVRKYMAPRYQEGYERGIHDQDVAKLLFALLEMYQSAGLLRYSPRSRALALLYCQVNREDSEQFQRKAWSELARSLSQLERSFNVADAFVNLRRELAAALADFSHRSGLPFEDQEAGLAAEYLSLELAKPKLLFEVSNDAVQLAERLRQQMKSIHHETAFTQTLQRLADDIGRGWQLAASWVDGLLSFQPTTEEDFVRDEAVALILLGDRLPLQVQNVPLRQSVSSLLGDHGLIQNQKMTLVLPEFLARLHRHASVTVPAFEAFKRRRSEVVEKARKQLRLEDFKARPLSSFVRNRLINEVYLPIIGDNLAKQLGTVGEDKRTDQMGLLLLISPPGYGKTTLMEYIANRMGLIFMKINCPSLGHEVTSLDPAQAPNATARQELEKLNLGLEMANNVMLYLDDIQHTHPEFLQKFISLSDGTRRIEGVWKGEPKTHDLRGKKFCVVMAGNPYTESGEVFKIPDMLANRADIYNLGDVLSGREEAFSLSYIENSLTSNPALSPLATRDMEDVYRFIRLAKGEHVADTDFSHPYSGAERNEIVGVLQRLFRVQQTVMRVNRQYIESAAQADKYRTEPPFKLQGSYRNMNKLAEKVSAVMNDAELNALLQDHYVGEAQTLTSGAEENLLKLTELNGSLSEDQGLRWEKIKADFARIQSMGGEGADSVTRIANQIAQVSSGLGSIEKSLVRLHEAQPFETLNEELRLLVEQLRLAELNVEVINKPVPGMDKVLNVMGDAITQSLLPVVAAMEHKLKLDHDIWERVKLLGDQIGNLERALHKSEKSKRRVIVSKSKAADDESSPL
ncbi:MAG: DNA repair ATPase [Candidatus Thiodiazotropha sp.]